jgi:hypothetical protein
MITMERQRIDTIRPPLIRDLTFGFDVARSILIPDSSRVSTPRPRGRLLLHPESFDRVRDWFRSGTIRRNLRVVKSLFSGQRHQRIRGGRGQGLQIHGH